MAADVRGRRTESMKRRIPATEAPPAATSCHSSALSTSPSHPSSSKTRHASTASATPAHADTRRTSTRARRGERAVRRGEGFDGAPREQRQQRGRALQQQCAGLVAQRGRRVVGEGKRVVERFEHIYVAFGPHAHKKSDVRDTVEEGRAARAAMQSSPLGEQPRHQRVRQL